MRLYKVEDDGYGRRSKATLDDIKAYLAERGLVAVPVEADQHMIVEAEAATGYKLDVNWGQFKSIYRAMVKAAALVDIKDN